MYYARHNIVGGSEWQRSCRIKDGHLSFIIVKLVVNFVFELREENISQPGTARLYTDVPDLSAFCLVSVLCSIYIYAF